MKYNLVAEIDGDIDHHSAEIIRDKLEREFARAGAKNIIFDLKRVSFMDSSGIGMILGRYRALEKLGGEVAVAGVSPEASRVFELSGLQKLIKVYSGVESAVEYL
jgi:stage II sporulation protein AA (anti-sigma F factor antagonist)